MCGGVLQASSLLGGIGELGLSASKISALVTAKELAEKAGAAQGAIAGKARGMAIVIEALKQKGIAQYCPEIFESIQKIERFTELKTFSSAIIKKNSEFCSILSTGENPLCAKFGVRLGTFKAIDDPYGTPAGQLVPKLLEQVAYKADQAAAHVTKTTSESVTAAIKARETALIEG
ncbi:hypothetical protein PFNF135_00010 [Plasmodium falciparum NF135/5.C10]|uniref:Surface antigen n=1 Tax=Plasmodium falciparum NF135/5.C10 TaxID=1036726 RepID=W4IP45_PLAFA|nr:hypothetical protein PFNF135_00010 [Plasmodium falciparum NF135/5.C10]